MPVETRRRNERMVSEPVSGIIEEEAEDSLRELARERVYRLRRFKLHLIVFALGLSLVGVAWVLTEYYEEHTWPSRFASAPDVAGTWDPGSSGSPVSGQLAFRSMR